MTVGVNVGVSVGVGVLVGVGVVVGVGVNEAVTVGQGGTLAIGRRVEVGVSHASCCGVRVICASNKLSNSESFTSGTSVRNTATKIKATIAITRKAITPCHHGAFAFRPKNLLLWFIATIPAITVAKKDTKRSAERSMKNATKSALP